MQDHLMMTLVIAMTPVGELRASIPFGIASDLHWISTLGISIVGNLVPVPFILLVLRILGKKISSLDNFLGSLMRWRQLKLERDWGPKIHRFGFWGVVLIVGIPLPLTGAWTGSLAVWALGVPYRIGLPAIALGVAFAGVIVTILTVAGTSVFQFLGAR